MSRAKIHEPSLSCVGLSRTRIHNPSLCGVVLSRAGMHDPSISGVTLSRARTVTQEFVEWGCPGLGSTTQEIVV